MCKSPNQIIEMGSEEREALTGWGLFFHHALLSNTFLSNKMKDYAFFSYEALQVLYLSEKERLILYDLITSVAS